MPGARDLSQSQAHPQARDDRLIGWLSKGIAILTLVVTVVILAVYMVLAVRWQTRPYLGVMLSPEMMVVESHSLSTALTPAEEAGLQIGDRLTAVGGQDLSGDYWAASQELAAILSQYQPGDRIRVRFERSLDAGEAPGPQLQCVVADDQRLCASIFPLVTYPAIDFVLQFVLSWLVGVVGLVLAAILLRWRWEQDIARMVAIFSALLAMIAAGAFDLSTARLLSPVLYVNELVLIAGLMLIFTLYFPSRLLVLQRQGWLRLIAPLFMLIGVLAGDAALRSMPVYTEALRLSVAAVAVAWVILFGGMIWRVNRAVSPVVRDQVTLVMAGMLLCLAPILTWIVSNSLSPVFLNQNLGFHFSLVTPFLLLIPAAMMYALAQDELPKSDTLISRSIVYTIMALAITLGYALLVAGSALLTGSVIQANNPVVIAFTVFLMALLFVPVRSYLEKRVNEAYFRTHSLYQRRVETLAQDLTLVTSLDGIVNAIRSYLNEALNPTHTFLFFPDEEAGQYVAHGVPAPETDIRFSLNSPLVRMLERQQRPLYLEPEYGLPPELAPERARLAVLGAPVLVPLRGRDRLSGILAVGPRHIAERYHYDDLSFVQALADQAALAVERAQVVADLEQRVREMNVLGQVAQAVNFTIEFDDLLELIYAQTNRVISAPNLYITLRDPYTDELYYAFYAEEDERLTDKEGIRWRMGRDLLSEIVRVGQPIRLENYGVEVARRGVQSSLDNMSLKAWMGVPLNAPTTNLGVISIGSTAISVSYSDEQLKILWQIADQAAIAIDKARLFRETEIRARQLTALNQISTQLATVFQDTARLLDLIITSAVRILEAEAGSLLLIDPGTQQLEFKVVIGAGADELVGTRLPPGTGLAGMVADRGEPVIVNDTTRDPRWFAGVDASTEFVTSTLMAAPLMGNSGVIGVLEVINKRDGGVFVEDDKRLLVTFAGQAAIAIENARLFEMTDDQLASRVSELDTMQKIDRELNETLKLQRVLDITLDWAMRESAATAGALGMVVREPASMRVMASYGYPEDSPIRQQASWPLDHGIVGRVVRSGQPALVSDVQEDSDYVESMAGVRSQLTVPLFSGGEVSGIIMLESTHENAFSLLDLDFISRLAEHASPALSNAILFSQLERANEARSEFVGFVAHELKTPMTSIKGFADLLLGGVVGPLNEQQKNFLGTIRANVERMNTLVSDLNDVTKLQTDRMHMEMASVDFRLVVQETLQPLQKEIEDKGQTVHLEISADLPRVFADQNRLIQVLTNLVTNAHKYTPPDGQMTIRAAPSHNMWSSGGPSEVLHVSVQDNGIGISEEDVKKLFTPYFRTSNPLVQEQSGTGLGLVIVRGIVEQHGGRIWVESHLGQGSTFHFTIPLASEVIEADR